MVPNRRRPSLKLLTKLLPSLAHVRVSHVHLSEEMIRQTTVVIESTKVCAAHVADLQFLVAGGAGGILEIFEFALAGFLLVFGSANLVEFVEGEGDGACFSQDGDFEETCVDCFREIGDLFQLVLLELNNGWWVGSTYEIIRLPNLIWRLLQPPLSRINPPITIIDILLHIAHVVKVEPPFRLFPSRRKFVLRLQTLAVHLRTRTEVLLGIREEIVRAGSHEIRATHFRIGD